MLLTPWAQTLKRRLLQAFSRRPSRWKPHRTVGPRGFAWWHASEVVSPFRHVASQDFAVALERLEDRCLLATFAWDGGAGTLLWNDAANWSTDVLPGSTDDVTIDATGAVTITSTAAVTVKSLTTADHIELTSGSLSVLETATFNGGLSQSGGAFYSGSNQANSNAISIASGNTLVVGGLPGLVSVWHGEGNANDGFDGNNGTLTNGATFDTGKYGQGFSLSGASQHVALPTSSQIPIGDSAYTLSAWINPDVAGASGIIGFGNYGANNQVNALRLSGNFGSNIGFYNYWWGNDLQAGTTTPVGSGWHHVAATYDGTTRQIIFDGVVIGSDTPTGHNVPSASNFRIGSTNGGEFFDGGLDEVAVYNRALSLTEIQAIVNSGAYSQSAGTAAINGTLTATSVAISGGSATLGNGTISNVVSLYKAEGNANDSADGNNGTLTNGATTTTSGRIGSAFSFDGVNDYVSIPHSANLDLTTAATYSAWIKLDQLPSNAGRVMSIMAKSAVGNDLDFQVQTDNKVYFYAANGSASSSTVLTTGTWFHVAATYQGNSAAKVYVNGVLEGTGNVTSTRTANSNPLIIGENSVFTGRFWKGQIDEATVFDRALTANEIASLAAATTSNASGATLTIPTGKIVGPLSITSSGTLNGIGTIAGNLTNAATVAPGNSPGIITVNGNYSQTSTGDLNIEIGGTTVGTQYDQLIVNGTVTLNGDLNLSLINSFVPTNGNTFTIIDNDGTDAVSGTFSGLAQGATVVLGNTTFQISYAGGTGNDVVLTTSGQEITWDGGAGTLNWNDANNWSTNTLPGTNDVVIIDIAGTNTVTSSGTVSIRSLTSNETLAITNGTFTIANASQLNGGLTLAGGTLTASGAITVNNTLDWTSGTINGSGTTTVTNTATLAISGGGGKSLDSHTLVNNGNGTLSGGNLALNNSALFDNNGTLNATDESDITRTNGTPTFQNDGTFNKSGTGTSTQVSSSINFNNTGTVNIDNGTLLLAKGTSSGGTFDVDAGHTLEFNGSYTANNPTTFTGAGTVLVSSGTFTVSTGPVSFSNLSLSTDLLADGNVNINNSFAWNTGGISGAGTTTVANTATFAISGTGGKSLNAHTLVNNTAATLSGANLALNTAATFDNNGTFNATDDADITRTSGTSTFQNDGTFNKSGTGTSTQVSSSISFNNTGTVNIDNGTLLLAKGTSSGGTFDVDAGRTLEFNSSYTANNPTTFTGAGTVLVSSGTFTVSTGPVSFSNLSLSTDLLADGNVTINNSLAWNTGAVSGMGTTTVANGATFAITGGGGKSLNTHTLVNNGTATLSGANLTLNSSALFDNNGTFNATDEADISRTSGTSTFQNDGTFHKSGTGTTTHVSSSVAFNNPGTVNAASGTFQVFGSVAQHSGSTLTGGIWSVTDTLILDQGSNITTNQANVTLNGSGATFARFTGTITANSGTLTIANRLFATPAGFTSSGTLNAQSGATVVTSSDFTNTGSVTIDPTSQLLTRLAGEVSRWSGEGNANDLTGAANGIPMGDATTSAGQVGQAFEFDGAGDAVRFGDVHDTVFAGADKKFSFSFWTKVDAIASGVFIAKAGDSVAGSENQRQFYLSMVPDGRVAFTWHGSLGTGEYRGIYTTSALSVGTWTHITLAYDGSVDTNNGLDRVTTYFNGVVQPTTLVDSAGSVGDIQNGTAKLAIGAAVASNNGAAYFLDGKMDEVSVYSRVLSAAEAAALAVNTAPKITQTSGTTNLGTGGVMQSGLDVNGGSLVGVGTVNGNVGNAAVVAPGNSPGIITINGNYSQTTDGDLNIEIGGTTVGTQYDQLDVNGTVTLDGALNVSLINSFVPTIGNTFTIIDNDETDAVSDTFDGLAEGSTVTVSGSTFTISYVGGTGNDVVLTATAPVTTGATISGNDLVISDTGNDSNDSLTISTDGTSLTISDPNNALSTGIAGATGSGTTTIVVPLSAFTGAIIINGGDGNDSLAINLGSGNFGRAITFNGGGQTTGDSLTVTGGGTFASVAHNFTNANDGSISVTGNSTINYTGLEPITDNLSATDRVFTFSNGNDAITLVDVTGANMTIDSNLAESVTFANPTNSLTINAGDGTDTVAINSVDGAFAATFNVNGDGGTDAISLAASLSLGSGNLSFNAETINLGANVQTDGGSVLLTGNTVIATSSVLIDTESGDNSSAGSVTFSGGSISASGADRDLVINTSTGETFSSGNISLSTVNGTGGSALRHLTLNAARFSTPGTGSLADVTLAGAITLASNGNLDIDGQTVTFSTSSSDVSVSGTGTATINASRNVAMSAGSSLTTVNGNLTVNANQQATPSTGDITGVNVNNGLIQATGSGAVTVKGKGGNDSGGLQYGVRVQGGGGIIGGTSGLLTVQGTGGASAGDSNYGVGVTGTNSMITSSGGNVSVTGTGGGAGASAINIGVDVLSAGQISAGGSGTVTVVGQGGNTTGSGNFNFGIYVDDAGSTITSSGGNVSVTGTGGGAGSSRGNRGVVLVAGQVSAGGSGTVTVVGQGGTTTGQFSYGVQVGPGSASMTSSGGNVSVTGIGGGAGGSSDNYGVVVFAAGTIGAGVSGTVSVDGTGGTGSAGFNQGVFVTGSSSMITSSGGNVQVTGMAGSGPSSFAIDVETSGSISTAISGGSGTLIGNSMNFDNSAVITANSTSTVTLRQKTNGTTIGLGAADAAGILGLTDAELDRVTAGTVNIGNADSGTITVSAAITHGNNLSLTTGAGITVNQAVTMASDKSFSATSTSTTAGISLATASSDIAATGTGTISVTATRQINLNDGASLTTVNGSLTVSANAAGTTGGAFTGVDVIDNAVISSSGTGGVVVISRGGAAGGDGIHMSGGRILSTGTGTIAVTGTGGDGAVTNRGVFFRQFGKVSSVTGDITVTGQGGGGAGTNNHGVWLINAGAIESTGAANITVVGSGGTGGGDYSSGVSIANARIQGTGSSSGTITVTGTAGSGANSYGVELTQPNFTAIESNNQAITIIADSVSINPMIGATNPSIKAGTGTVTFRQKTAGTAINLGGADAAGVLGLTDAELDVVTAGTVNIGNADSGTITVSAAITHGNNLSLTTGAGITVNQAVTMASDKSFSATSTSTTAGISLPNGTSDITSSGTGAISLTAARSVALASGSSLTTVNGNLTVSANQQTTATTGNFVGVDVNNGVIEATGTGTVTVQGKGGDHSSGFQIGVQVLAGGDIRGGTSGLLTVAGTSGASSGTDNHGIYINGTGSTITSSGGNVSVTGNSSTVGSGSNGRGILMESSSQISAGGSGSVTVLGEGSDLTTGSGNFGLYIVNSTITSSGGNVSVTGNAGGMTTSSANRGVQIERSEVSATGTGTVTVTGVGGTGSGGDNQGVRLRNTNARIISAGGAIQITGTAGQAGADTIGFMSDATGSISGGPITLIANSVAFDTSASPTTINAGTATVTLRPQTNGTAINLGSTVNTTASTLELSDAELDRITAGAVQIGDSTSGAITVSAAITHANNLSLTTGVGITANDAITMAVNKSLTTIAVSTISLATTNSDFATTGSGTISLNTQRDILLTNGSSIATANGAITLQANVAGTASGDFTGIDLSGASITSSAGAISLEGRGGTTGDTNSGVHLRNASKVESTGTGAGLGAITVTGTGGSGGFFNMGVQLQGAGTSIETTDANIQLNGTGGSGSPGIYHGTLIWQAAMVKSDGVGANAGTITFNGTGGSGGARYNHGVEISGTATLVTSIDGDISVNGTGGSGSGATHLGFVIWDSAQLTSTGTGNDAANITIIGVGGSGTDEIEGVRIEDNTRVTTVDGDVQVTGTGGTASGSGAYGVFVRSSAKLDSTGTTANAGDITITGTGSNGAAGIRVNSATLGDAAGTGDLTLTANTVELASSAVVRGAGTLTIKPLAASTSIGLGGGVGTLNLDDTELGFLSDGFSSITIGDSTSGTGAVDVDSSVFTDPVTVVGGSMFVTELVAGTNAVTLTARTGAITDGGNVASDVAAGLLTLTAVSGIGSNDALETNATTLVASTSAAGNIRVSDASGLTLGSGGNGISTFSGDIEITAAGTITVSNEVNARGNGNVTLTASTGDIQVNANVLSTLATSGSLGDGTGTLLLDSTVGAITDDGSGTLMATAGKLNLQAATGIGTSGNRILTSVAQLAADLSAFGGGLFVTEADDLSIATVGSQVGISTVEQVNLQLNSGTLTIPTNLGQYSIRTGFSSVTLTVDDLTIETSGTFHAIFDTNSAIIQNLTLDRQIDLGTNTAGKLSLTSAEIQKIPTYLTIGRNDALKSGEITISANVSTSGGGIGLKTGAGVTGTAGGINTNGLGIYSSGTVNMTAPNNVGFLEISAAGQDVTFVEANGVTVAGGALGITSRNLSLTVNAGDLFVERIDSVAYEIDSTGTVTLTVSGNDALFQIINGAIIRSESGDHVYTADKMNLAGTITATGRIVTLKNAVGADEIRVGSDVDTTANTLEFGVGETFRISADTLRIGSATAGALSVTQNFSDYLTVPNVHLITGSTLTATTGVIGRNLSVALEAGGTVTVTHSNTKFNTLAVSAPGQDVTIIEADGFTVGDVDGVQGISGRNISLTATTGNITVSNGSAADDIAASGTVSLETSADNALLTIASSAVINGISGDHTYTADKMDLQGTITATGRSVTLKSKTAGDTIDVGSTVDNTSNTVLELSDAELDRITASGLTVGSTSAGTITVSANLTQPGKNLTLQTGASVTGSVSLTTGADSATTLTIDQADNSTFSGTLGGGGTNENNFGFTKTGAGTLTLGGANTYNGTTSVNGGTLLINGSLDTQTNGVVVASSAVLGGSGNIQRPVVINTGAALSPGNSPGLLSTGNLTLNGNYNVELNGGASPTVGSDYDQTNVTGTINLSGSTLVVSGTRTTNNDNSVIVVLKNDGTDAVTGTFNGLPEGAFVQLNGILYQITYTYNADGGSVANDVALIDAAPLTLYWDADGDASAAVGGTGTWDTTSLQWRINSPTGPLVAWGNSNNDDAVFPSSSGTVSVQSSGVSARSLRILVTGYSLQTDRITLPPGEVTFEIPTNVTTTISSLPAGTSGLIKENSGTLVLTGTNTYTGPTVVNAGRLLVNGSTSSSSPVTVNNGGTLGGTGTVGGTVTVSGGGAVAPGASPGILSTGSFVFLNKVPQRNL